MAKFGTGAILFSVLLQFTACVSAQLSLPNPAFLPPNASWGAVPSSGGSPNPQWTVLLGNSLYFYEAQRSGRLPSTNRVSWRNDSALNDGRDSGLDLSGGYYDAGNYLKCTFPLSFTLMSACWGALDFGKGYDMTTQTPYLDDMLRWGLDWLIKAHPSNSTLFVQVADPNYNDAYWGGDQNIPSARPSYQVNDTNPGTDVAAAASAAFAACSILYSNSTSYNSSNSSIPFYRASLQNGTYSDTLLSHAKSLWTFANQHNSTLYQDSVPAVEDTYPSSDYKDDLTFAALWMSWASNDVTLYNQTLQMYNNYGLGGSGGGLDGVFNWDGKTPGIPILATQIGSIMEEQWQGYYDLNSWQTHAETYLDGVVNGQGRAHTTNGGLLYYDGDSDEASLNPALNAAMLMTRYAPMASSPQKKWSYQSYASSQLDYVLGNNPMSVPYVVGMNPNSPQNPHSAMASGGDDISHIDTVPAQEAYVLYGAVVGGPDSHDKFWDIRSDWPETEVALDYNAPLLTLAAAHVMNDTSDPYYTTLQVGAYSKPKYHPCDAVFSCTPSLSTGAKIAMGVCLGATGLVIAGLTGYWLYLNLGNRFPSYDGVSRA
ncbi:glycoside hydrolase family 9 protein [Neolentinus lepideus HHB14362 ss-1]|uniref:Endoglucanase n=1 Tax=Neolentinus lepideus HHB14362 ss-1 TaxID=1314782 RepID=A0A165PAV7_9AGAM|nr:glycoside hydrolase family 9 protein [Neolentinus lepideus HHB14362 ss-1]